MLERMVANDRWVVSEGERLAGIVDKHFEERHERENTHYYDYMIMCPQPDEPLTFEPFVQSPKYVGSGVGKRIDQHNLDVQSETVSVFH
jgi:hypothetical protein